MDLVDITDWAADEIKTIRVKQISLGDIDADLTLEVKKFIPVEGDLITEVWTDHQGTIRTHDIPPYALADMEKTAKTIQEFVDANIIRYIIGTVGNLDPLLWNTYFIAFKHANEAAVS